jgi:hypothetical protein
MARQGGRVQLEQSNMHLALNMAKMATGGFSHAAMEETQQLIQKPCAKVREQNKWGVEFPGHNKLKPAIQRHQAIVHENKMDGCLSCQNGTTNYRQISWRLKGNGTPPRGRVPPWPGTASGPSDDDESAEREGVSPAYVYIHTPVPCAQFLPSIACAIKILFQMC